MPFPPPELISIDWLLALVVAWLLIGFAGLLAPRELRFVGRTLYPLGALVGLALAAVAFGALGETP